MDVVLGTHASSTLMAYLAFKKTMNHGTAAVEEMPDRGIDF